MSKIVALSPTRVDLAGGTLDLWPVHHLLEKKTTVNIAISLYSSIELSLSQGSQYQVYSTDQGLSFSGNFDAVCRNQELPLLGLLISAFWDCKLPAISLRVTAQSPQGAGLGGSSSLAITIGGALSHLRQSLDGSPSLDEHALVRTVRDVESKLIRIPAGVQDYWAALRGGLNLLSYPFGGEQVLTLEPAHIKGLEEQALVCYSGQSRASAINNWEIFKRVFDGDKKVIDLFEEIGAAALDCAESAKKKDLTGLIQSSKREWALRCKLWPGVETEKTRAIDRAAVSKGALFTRVCGAGGGGAMLVLCPPDAKPLITKAIEQEGGRILTTRWAEHGFKLVQDI
ncbi:MAG: hypothetical protein KA436_09295 [Oligoflexales bacterium]|nr:hypothetical protein [Oligoflexales bacterium]